MSLPGYKTCMLPPLRFASDGKEYKHQVAIAASLKVFMLTTEARQDLLLSEDRYVTTNPQNRARLGREAKSYDWE